MIETSEDFPEAKYELQVSAGTPITIIATPIAPTSNVMFIVYDSGYNAIEQVKANPPGSAEILADFIAPSSNLKLKIFGVANERTFFLNDSWSNRHGERYGAFTVEFRCGNDALSTDEPQPTESPVFVSITLTLFLDENSLTLYVPQADVPVVLSDLAFQVQIGTDTVVRKLADYASFLGLPFDDLPTPICFRLVRAGTNSPLPLECQNIRLVLIQSLASADVFWFDPLAAGARLVTVYQDIELVGICQTTEAGCPVDVILAAVMATPFSTATLTPAVSVPTATATSTIEVTTSSLSNGECLAEVVSGNAPLNVVRLRLFPDQPLTTPIEPDSTVIIMDRDVRDGHTWYQIHYGDNYVLQGWLREEYLIPPINCSQ
ncbi:MAG: hypothetical protein K8L99_20245 [Anaerolineae bacterium]|nr:hypothetical protein [Anaerolineae bacterium]